MLKQILHWRVGSLIHFPRARPTECVDDNNGEFTGSGRLIAIDFRLLQSTDSPLTVTLASLLL